MDIDIVKNDYEKNTVKVISFNVRYRDDKNGNSILERAPRLKKVCEPYDADVIGLQEFSPAWEKPIEEFFGDEYAIHNVYRSDVGNLEGTPILWKRSKFDCIDRGHFWLSETPYVMSNGYDDLGLNRISIYALLRDKVSGKKFLFLNTHFGFGDENQAKSAKLVNSYLKKFGDFPIVITGDLNATPSTKCYKVMEKNFTDVNRVLVNDQRTTFHGYLPEINSDAHIDYCFINSKFSPKNYKIITELVDGKCPSDHFGIFAELKF